MFGKDFAWGVADSAYQIEGRDPQDGCGKNVWDVFCEEGRVYGGQNAQVACDHIHRYKEDFALMRMMGVKNYRFSLNWARILPEGTGRVNQAGIDYYKDMIREMRAQNKSLWQPPHPLDFQCRGPPRRRLVQNPLLQVPWHISLS